MKAKHQPAPKKSGHNKRWMDEYPMTPTPNRRFAQQIGGDTGGADKPVTFPKTK